jgi:enamine deaminase RidA (YjgF/YER057c/UK114 family)
MTIDRTNPDGMYRPHEGAYSQVIGTDAGRLVFVAGTVAKNERSELVGVDDMERQVEKTLANVERSLAVEGADLTDVVRIRIFTTDVERYLTAGQKAMPEFFGPDAVPTSTLLEVSRLADSFDGVAEGEPTDVEPHYLVEIDVTAVVD